MTQQGVKDQDRSGYQHERSDHVYRESVTILEDAACLCPDYADDETTASIALWSRAYTDNWTALRPAFWGISAEWRQSETTAGPKSCLKQARLLRC